jgi:hypothetical protein
MNRRIGLALAFLVLATLACDVNINTTDTPVPPTVVPGGQQPPGGGEPPSGDKPPGQQPPDGGEQPPSGGGQQPPSGGSSTIVLHNNSGQTIWYAYVSSCSDSTWGEDDLGSSTVPNGSTFSFSVPAGCYDLKAEDSSHNVIGTDMGTNVSGTYNWYVP